MNTNQGLTKNAIKDDPDKWILRLYVAGQTPKSITAFDNLKEDM